MSTVTGRGRERRDCQTMKCCIVHGAVIHSTRRTPRATPSNRATHRDCRTCDVHHRRRADAHRVHAARRSPREHNASTVLGIAAIPAGIRSPQTSSPSRRPPRSRHTASTSTSLSRWSAPSLASPARARMPSPRGSASPSQTSPPHCPSGPTSPRLSWSSSSHFAKELLGALRDPPRAKAATHFSVAASSMRHGDKRRQLISPCRRKVADGPVCLQDHDR